MTWISDGDTIVVDTNGAGEIDVRLLGINAPDREECFYDEATDYLIDSLKGRRVGLSHTSFDQFGRTLAYVWDGGAHVNQDLVEKGFAIATTPDEGEPYGSELLAAEARAVDQKSGLWSATACGSGDIPPIAIEPRRSNANPSGADDEDLGHEVITIENQGFERVDISGWILRDESSRHRYRFPARSGLDPGEAIGVASDDAGWSPGGGPVWNNDGDMAMILDADGRVVDRWRY